MLEIINILTKILTFSFDIPLSIFGGTYLTINIFGLLIVFFVIFIIGVIFNRLFH